MVLKPRHYTILNLLVLAIVIYGGVRIFYTLAGSKLTSVTTEEMKTKFRGIAPQETTRPPLDHYLPAVKRELFGPVKESAEKSELNAEDLEPAALNIELLGTVSGNTENAVAIMKEARNKEQSLYKEGDSIEDATVVKILRGKVILRVGDENQILSMEEKPRSPATPPAREPGPGAASSPTPDRQSATVTLDRAAITESLQNINEILSQVRVRPHYRDGKADGLMLSQIKPNTIFTQMRLRNGDVVQSVNGKPISSPDDIMGFYEELKSGDSVSLDISRRGRNTKLNYTFK